MRANSRGPMIAVEERRFLEVIMRAEYIYGADVTPRMRSISASGEFTWDFPGQVFAERYT